MNAFNAWRESSDVVQEIGEFHLAAVASEDGDLPLLLYAQGIDVARSLLHNDKKTVLPESVRSRQKRDLNWLFEMCNQRRETRHAIDKQDSLELKAQFTDEERDDFLHDSGLLLHFVVTRALGIPLVFNENGRTIESIVG